MPNERAPICNVAATWRAYLAAYSVALLGKPGRLGFGCNTSSCQHYAPLACTIAVIRWGPDVQTIDYAPTPAAPVCGSKGATLRLIEVAFFDWRVASAYRFRSHRKATRLTFKCFHLR